MTARAWSPPRLLARWWGRDESSRGDPLSRPSSRNTLMNSQFGLPELILLFVVLVAILLYRHPAPAGEERRR